MELPELVRVLTTWAVQLSGLPAPEALPVVELRDHAFFVQNACPGQIDCPVIAWYNDRGVIYWDIAVSYMERDDVLLHEVFHYVDDMARPDKAGCDDYIKAEVRAYKVQADYLIATGRMAFRAYAPRPMVCPKE